MTSAKGHSSTFGSGPTSLHQLGQYVVLFQTLEQLLNVVLMQTIDDVDQEIVKILVHELEFGKRVNTADVLFSYVVRLRFPEQVDHIKDFHKLAEDIVELSKRRNDLVHSNYMQWIDITGREGLVRSHSKLKPSKGERVHVGEDLLPESFSKDLKDVEAIIGRLERFRLLLIDWHYPDVD